MREELDGAPEALSWALGVAVQVSVLAVVAAARVVLAGLGLAVCLCLDVLVQLVVLGEVPEQALLPLVCSLLSAGVERDECTVGGGQWAVGSGLTFVLLAANLAQQHAAQLLAPVGVLGVVLFYQAVVVALALGVGRAVELLLRGPIAHHGALLVDHVEAVRFGREDGVEGRHGLRHGGRRLREHCAGGVEGAVDVSQIAFAQVIARLQCAPFLGVIDFLTPSPPTRTFPRAAHAPCRRRRKPGGRPKDTSHFTFTAPRSVCRRRRRHPAGRFARWLLFTITVTVTITTPSLPQAAPSSTMLLR